MDYNKPTGETGSSKVEIDHACESVQLNFLRNRQQIYNVQVIAYVNLALTETEIDISDIADWIRNEKMKTLNKTSKSILASIN